MNNDIKIVLGLHSVRDKVTGFTGAVVAESQHITGCRQIYLLPRCSEVNKYPEGCWFDETRLEALNDRMLDNYEDFENIKISTPEERGAIAPPHPDRK